MTFAQEQLQNSSGSPMKIVVVWCKYLQKGGGQRVCLVRRHRIGDVDHCADDRTGCALRLIQPADDAVLGSGSCGQQPQ